MKEVTLKVFWILPESRSQVQTEKSSAKKGLFTMIVFGLFFFSYVMNAQVNIRGVAPVQTPPQGFAIDGDAFAGQPSSPVDFSAYGDWFVYGDTPGGIFPADINVNNIDENGQIPGGWPYDHTFFFRDDITNMDPTIFTSSNKINDNPITYTWGSGSSPNKNEIQNAMVHFSFGNPLINPPGDLEPGDSDDLWIIFAADRQVTNGSSYIDFELLQKPLIRTGTGSGGFTTEGLDGGRTENDILITLEFTQGGGAANVVVRRWEPDGAGGFYYADFIANPTGDKVLYSTNNNQTIQVPYPLYSQSALTNGNYQYAINQWAEGAANLSAIFGSDPCFNISTLFVRTRTSGSSGKSELKDFPGGPVQLQLDLNPIADLTTNGVCDGENAIFTATPNDGGEQYTFFIDTDMDGEIDGGEQILQARSTTNTFSSDQLNHGDIVTVLVETTLGCIDSASEAAVIYSNPTATAGNDGPVCYDATTIGLSETGGDAVSWKWASDGSATFDDDELQNPTASNFVNNEKFTVTITDVNGCTSTADTTITVDPEPTATAGNDGPVCYDATTIGLSETGGDAVSWKWASDGSATFDDDELQNPTASNFVNNEKFTVTITDVNGCTSTADTTITVDPEPTATAGNDGPVCYDATTIGLSETGGDAVSWKWASDGSATFDDDELQNPTASNFVNNEKFTVTITDVNGCTSTADTTITVDPEPTATAGNDGPVCYDATTIGLSETGGDAVSWSWESDGNATFDDATLQNPTASNFVNNEKFTVTITDVNGCTSTADTTITVDPEPTCSASNSGPACEGDTVQLFESSGDAVSWSWESDGNATFDDATLQNPIASNFVNGEIFEVTITDSNGCISKCTTTVTVESCDHIFPTQTSCESFLAGDPVLEEVCLTVGNNGRISNAVPGVFFYYSEYYATQGGATSIIVDQENAQNLGIFDPQNDANVRLYGPGCETATYSVEILKGSNKGDVKIEFNAVAGLTYVVSVKYDVKSLRNTLAPTGTNVYSFRMRTTVGTLTDEPVPGSTGQLDVLDCSAAVSSTSLSKATEDLSKESISPDESLQLMETSEPMFSAYPIPFMETLNIGYKFDYTSDVTIQIFNLNGQLVKSYTEKAVNASTISTLDIDFERRASQIYIVRMITDREVFTKKIISAK